MIIMTTELIKANVDIVKVVDCCLKGSLSVKHRVCTPTLVLLLNGSEVQIDLIIVNQLIPTTPTHNSCHLLALLLNCLFL